MIIIKGETAINIAACKIIRADEDVFLPKIVFDESFNIRAPRPAQALEEIIKAYERGEKVYRLRGD